VTFGRADAARVAEPGRLRAMRLADLPALAQLYERATARRSCAAVRDEAVWRWLLRAGRRTWTFPNPKVILEAGGDICGYLTLSSGDWGVAEIVVRPQEAACRAAMGALVRAARRHEVKEIKLPLPWDDALAVFLRQHVGGTFRMHANPTGGALMKIVDLPALMRRMAPALAERWKGARTALPNPRFTLESEIGRVGIAVDKDKVHVGEPLRGPRVRVPQRWLPGLITGYYRVQEIAQRDGARVPARLIPALEILFPSGWPFVYQGDNF